ncbi:tetraprenyl-beta-curcumene synthase family protein [Laspinema sp. D1]|uniref:tetraprenyl-beta-curcumene synthase family protein n=1 Tax=Laspinema palackyanum TaxID=3231601 RepID=UPI003499C143|nr:tetraprenyl-beta-curcumene synthase family protein [Laspinema sp. D2b]
MKVPTHPLTLMIAIYQRIIPAVHIHWNHWKTLAQKIPNLELRKQALMSLETKRFHCEGGAIYGVLAKNKCHLIIKFIVGYQTLCDYLDNLCDRSTSLDPQDFRALHESIFDALHPGAETRNYYRFRKEQEDGGYLNQLVKNCQDVLKEIPAYPKIASTLQELASYYCDLQVHKHVRVEERVPRLKKWFHLHENELPQMQWFEFSACAGSTLGIFSLVSYACNEGYSDGLTQRVKAGYFPWVQGLHILLDYLIDREEDRLGGDLNFCFYYKNIEKMRERLAHFLSKANKSVAQLPEPKFHLMINQALLGIYLADRKATEDEETQAIAKHLLKLGGGGAFFFFLNGRLMAKLRQFMLGGGQGGRDQQKIFPPLEQKTNTFEDSVFE